MSRTGRCLCGAITFTCSEVHEVDACHCDMCRRWAGGPMFAARPKEISWTGAVPATYRSSDWAERGFCATCGTSLFYKLVPTSEIFINPHAFDDLSGLEFGLQVFVDEKPPFYDFANETKKMTSAEVIAAFRQGER